MILNIQGLRAVAALLVVFAHLEQFLKVLGVGSLGDGGVDLFFVISGFIMVYTTESRSVRPAEFLVNRIVRIVPMYWLITLTVFCVALVAPSLMQSTSASVSDLVKSLFFIPFKKANGSIHPTLFVGWTLNYEMFFYVLFSLGLLFRRRVLGYLMVTVVLAASVAFGGLFTKEVPLGYFYTRPIVLEFAGGMLLGTLLPYLKVSSATVVAIAKGACVAGVITPTVAALHCPDVPEVVASGLSAFITVGAALLLDRSGISLNSSFAKLAGDASYSIYLVHPFVTQACQKVGMRFAPDRLGAFVLIILTVVLVAAVGIGTHLLVEKPLTNFFKAQAKNLGWHFPSGESTFSALNARSQGLKDHASITPRTGGGV